MHFETHGEDCRGEPDLAPQHERWLGEWARETHGCDFLFVTGYPMVKRPFYTHPDPADPTYSNSFDLLFRGTELVTGGQRLHRYAGLSRRAGAREISGRAVRDLPGSVEVTECRRTVALPSGWSAFVMQLCGLENLREATLFPRDVHRLTP